MPLVVGVSFRRVGKVYYFDPGDIQLREGDFVIAETARGVEFGEVVLAPKEVTEDELVAPLKRVVRLASGDDLQREASNREREAHAYEVCDRKIAEHRLPMKLLEAEFAFDGSQVTFSFSADGRIDFRDLVKDVAGILKTKVQLHQIGVRDEAKLIGGYGTCGRGLCCATFLSNFDPISMKMAKDQSLFLNPAKFSGCCGKLMCCLRYEHEYYKSSQKRLPAVGAILQLENGRAKVIDVNCISNMITVQTEEDVQVHIPAGELKLEGLCRRHGIACNLSESHCEPLRADVDAAEVAPDDEDDALDLDDDVIEPVLTEAEVVTPQPAISPAPKPEDNGGGGGSEPAKESARSAGDRGRGRSGGNGGRRGGRPWRRKKPGGESGGSAPAGGQQS